MAKIKKFKMKGRKMKTFDIMPRGEYLAEITESEWVETKAGDGEYLKFKWTILKGDYKNSNYWENLNLDNPNEETVRIAEDCLADINRACGYGEKLQADTEKYHGKPHIIVLGVKKTEDYGEQNTLRAVKHKDDAKQTGEKESKPWDTDEDSKKDKKKKEGKKKDKKKKKKK